MIAIVVAWVLKHMPLLLFVAALLLGLSKHGSTPRAQRLLAYLLLLPVGVEGLWAGLFHIFFPTTAASFIGWQVSPFQFEVGVADAAIGATAVLSFWRSLAFKSAVVCYVVLFYAGVAVGHVQQAIEAHNHAPGNFGALLAMTLIKIVLLLGLLAAVYRSERGARASEGASRGMPLGPPRHA